jgi:hypothetical protein
MNGCAYCGQYATQKCHVKDKHEFNGNKNHDFNNIIFLCAYCHYEYFDTERLAIDPFTNELIILRCIKKKLVCAERPKSPVAIKYEYIEWKNSKVHPYLKAALRRRRKSQDAMTEEKNL